MKSVSKNLKVLRNLLLKIEFPSRSILTVYRGSVRKISLKKPFCHLLIIFTALNKLHSTHSMTRDIWSKLARTLHGDISSLWNNIFLAIKFIKKCLRINVLKITIMSYFSPIFLNNKKHMSFKRDKFSNNYKYLTIYVYKTVCSIDCSREDAYMEQILQTIRRSCKFHQAGFHYT